MRWIWLDGVDFRILGFRGLKLLGSGGLGNMSDFGFKFKVEAFNRSGCEVSGIGSLGL